MSTKTRTFSTSDHRMKVVDVMVKCYKLDTSLPDRWGWTPYIICWYPISITVSSTHAIITSILAGNENFGKYDNLLYRRQILSDECGSRWSCFATLGRTWERYALTISTNIAEKLWNPEMYYVRLSVIRYVVTHRLRVSPNRIRIKFWLYVWTQGTQMIIRLTFWTYRDSFVTSHPWVISDESRRHIVHGKINNSLNLRRITILTSGSYSPMNSATPYVLRFFLQLVWVKSYGRAKISASRKMSTPMISEKI